MTKTSEEPNEGTLGGLKRRRHTDQGMSQNGYGLISLYEVETTRGALNTDTCCEKNLASSVLGGMIKLSGMIFSYVKHSGIISDTLLNLY